MGKARHWRLATAAGFILSILFAALTVASPSIEDGRLRLHWVVDPGELGRALRTVDAGAVALFVLLTYLTLPLRAARWGLVLSPRGTWGDRYHATSIGFMAVNLLPARLGEFARGLVLASRVPGLSKAQAIGSVMLARVLDLVGLWLICLPLPYVLALSVGEGRWLRTGLIGATALVAVCGLFIGLARRSGTSVAGWLGRVFGARAEKLFVRFCDGLGPGVSLKRGAAAVGGSVGVQLVSALAYAPLLAGVLPDGASPIWGAIFGLAVASAGLAIPSSPSGVGVYHFALAWALRALGASPADAAAVAVVTHLGSVAAFVGAGLVSMLFGRASASLGQIARESRAS